jgi:hypothetical protein
MFAALLAWLLLASREGLSAVVGFADCFGLGSTNFGVFINVDSS